jgi:hypothetical protein
MTASVPSPARSGRGCPVLRDGSPRIPSRLSSYLGDRVKNRGLPTYSRLFPQKAWGGGIGGPNPEFQFAPSSPGLLSGLAQFATTIREANVTFGETDLWRAWEAKESLPAGQIS